MEIPDKITIFGVPVYQPKDKLEDTIVLPQQSIIEKIDEKLSHLNPEIGGVDSNQIKELGTLLLSPSLSL